jgi:hypothetical protein
MLCVTKCSDGTIPGSTPTFGINNVCVSNCSVIDPTTWGDPLTNYRICTNNCTFTNTIKTYGYSNAGLCITTCPRYWYGLSP